MGLNELVYVALYIIHFGYEELEMIVLIGTPSNAPHQTELLTL
jgi:hypothetical protein